MLAVGLTGGIATGKSTVAAMFGELGAHIIDTDLIARQVVAPGKPAWQKIVDRFGPSIVKPDGQLKRKALAREIYNSDIKRWALNSIVHPPVIKTVRQKLRDIGETSPKAIVIADVPLLFETEWPFMWHKVLVVYIPQALQYERLKKRGPKVNQHRFRQMLRTQFALNEKARRADWVIDNSGSPEKTCHRVIEIYRQLQELSL